MRKIILLFLLMMSLPAQAVEIDGVVMEDTVHLGNSNLSLNGAGVRSKFIFDLYVVAMYLRTRQTSMTGVLGDVAEKRIALYPLRQLRSEDLMYGMRNGMQKNLSDEEMLAIKDGMNELESIFSQIRAMDKGDAIWLDYLPGIGTKVLVNAVVRGTIPGGDFNRALLKIWLGENPAQEAVKYKLLGGQ